jgi:CsoR family transcriptional regulator, copper-sensing transcriptional repressor
MVRSERDAGDLQTNRVRRLRSAAGHLGGVAGLVERGSDCDSVLRQVLAVQAALHEINRLILQHHLGECLQQDLAAVTMDPTAGERWMAEIVSLYELSRRS